MKVTLFGKGSYEQKKEIIDGMSVNELMNVSPETIKRVIDEAGKDGELNISRKFRKGNDWNSEIESVYVVNDKLYIGVYIQSSSTDTTQGEEFNKFFRAGEYYSSKNRFDMGVSYKESQKAEVMRSFLHQCAYNLFSDEAYKESIIGKLLGYQIVNPVLDHFYNLYRLRYKNISKYASRNTIAEITAYHNAEKELRTYIRDNYKDLKSYNDESLIKIYKDVFSKSMSWHIKNFDFNDWRKKHESVYW